MAKMTRQEAGRLGGRATVAKHGVEHMRTIGKAGFRKIVTRCGSNRRMALRLLHKRGRMQARYMLRPNPDEDRIATEMFEQFGLNASVPDVPF